MFHRVQQVAPRLRTIGRHHFIYRALRHQTTTALAGTRPNVDDMVGMADRVFVVLDHHQRIALVAQALQSLEQDLVVACMQTDRRLVKHITHALQIAAQLRCQPYALRFAATERRRATVQCKVAQADLLQKQQAAADLRDQVARNFLLALTQAIGDLQRLHPMADVGNPHAGQRGDRYAILRRDRQ